jgi:hypothetical protein
MSTANRSSYGTNSPNLNWGREEFMRPSTQFNGSTAAPDETYQIMINAQYHPTPIGGHIVAIVDSTAVREAITIRKLNDQLEGVTPQSNTSK